MELNLIRDFIQHYGLYMQMVACLAYIWRFRVIDAFTYICAGILILTPLHVVYGKTLLELAQNEEMRGLVRNLWYLGFALTDVLLVVVIAHISKKERLKLDFPTKALMFIYLLLAAIQLIGYVDQVITKTDYLANFYMVSIPVINLIVTAIIVTASLGSITSSLVKRSQS